MTEKDEGVIINLQAIIRGETSRKKFNKTIRQFLERKLEPFTDLDKNNKDIPRALDVLKWGERLVKTVLLPEDAQLVAKFARLLIMSMDAPKEKNFATMFLSVDYITRGTALVTKILNYVPDIFDNITGASIVEMKMWQSLIHFLIVFSSSNSWSLVRNSPQIQTVLNGMCTKMTSNLYDSKYCSLSLSLFVACNDQRPLLSNEALNALFSVIFRPFRDGCDDALPVFISHVLTCPALILHLSQQSRDMLLISGIFGKVLDYLYGDLNAIGSIPPNKMMNLMGNLVHLAYLDEHTTQVLVEDWSWILGLCMTRCTAYAIKPGETSQQMHWHPIFGQYKLPIGKKSEGALQNVSKQLELLWSSRIVNALFETALDGYEEEKFTKTERIQLNVHKNVNAFRKFWRQIGGRTPSGEGTISDLEPSLTAVVCKVYVSALSSMQHLKSRIISGICHNDTLLRRLWIYLRRWGLHEVSQTTSGSSSSYPLVTASIHALQDPLNPHAAPVRLFAEAAFTVLSILDDEEMYEKGSPFSQKDLASIAKFCNWFCFKAIWDGHITSSNKEDPLFTSIHNLLNILHSRDCRKSFVEPKTWLSPDVKSSNLIAEYEKKTPRGTLLMEKMSHTISLKDRMMLFRKLITLDKNTVSQSNARSLITVIRTQIVEDGYRHLSAFSPNALKGVIRVKFVNQQGLDEAGIDQDGVFKEFLELTLRKVFNPEFNLFTCTAGGVLYPSATSFLHDEHLSLFNFVGKMLGKAVYEGIVVDVQLAPVLLEAVIGGRRFCAFDQLAPLDPEMYKNLTFIKRYSGDVSDLCLTFSIDDDYLGKVVTTDLIPGGRQLAVTNENRIDYIHRMAHHRVFAQTREQCKYFVAGLQSILDSKWLSMFSPQEIQLLISGVHSDIDVSDLKKNVQYYGGFHGSHRLIKWLWEIVEKDFTTEERMLFLKFVTSCSRPPLLGFSSLQPPFSIRCVEVSDDQDQGDTLGSVLRGFLALRKNKSGQRLPTSSTCFNLLKLPNYNKKSVLLQKLRYAIHAESGFELS